MKASAILIEYHPTLLDSARSKIRLIERLLEKKILHLLLLLLLLLLLFYFLMRTQGENKIQAERSRGQILVNIEIS